MKLNSHMLPKSINLTLERKIKFLKILITKEKNSDEQDISLDTKVTLNLFEDLKYDLKSIRTGAMVKPIYLSKLPKDLKN